MQDRTHAEQTPSVNDNGAAGANDDKNQGMTAEQET
jgi:hypothetical protein